MATDGGQDVCVEGAVRGSVSFGMPRKMYTIYISMISLAKLRSWRSKVLPEIHLLLCVRQAI